VLMATLTTNGKAKGPGGAKRLVIKPLKREQRAVWGAFWPRHPASRCLGARLGP
jgi:hypothetical protein